jgi:hypothetical protein
MSRAPRKTKMTDKTPVDSSVTKEVVQANLPGVSPAKPPVDKPGVGSGGTGAFEVKGTYVPAPEHDIPAKVDPLLVTMLCWPRCHDSPEEKAFTNFLKDHIDSVLKQPIKFHAEGAFSVSIPLDKEHPGTNVFMESTTLFSCHVDTVDNRCVDPNTRKKLTYDPSFGQIALDSQGAGNCLGADDTAGIWLMLKMIESKCPGTYLFHRGEECGGVSAKAIARQESGWLQKFSVAVAFDRKDTGDIVTVQGGMRCASPKFASRLGGMLDAFGFKYMESTTGSYTDVKEYRKVIAECVNLSCGYDSAHSRNETLDYAHLAAMAEALPKVEWESLPVDRDPKAKDPEPAYQQWKGSRGFKDMGTLFDDDDLARQWGKGNGAKKKKTPLIPVGKSPVQDAYDRGFDGMSYEELQTAVEDDPIWACENIVRLMRANAKMAADIDVLNGLLGL